MPTSTVPANNTDNLVECEDGLTIPRRDAIQDANGRFWSSDEDLLRCVECDGLFHDEELNFDSDMCEDCHSDNHTGCAGCSDDVHIDFVLASANGDQWCESCYHDNHASCAECGTEHFLGRAGEYTEIEGEVFCDACAPDEEPEAVYEGCDCRVCRDAREGGGGDWEPDYTWRNRSGHDKVGSSRKFGVELETSKSPNYGDWSKNVSWGAKYDGSIRGKEFVSPPLQGNDGYDSVINFCALMEDNNCEVDSTCGYHLHVDLSDTNANQRKAIALAYHYTRFLWAQFVAPHRRETGYARRSDAYFNRDTIVDGEDHPFPDTRYIWINWRSFSRHKTVEIRSHEGTCDGRAVTNWIKAHTRFIDYVKDMSVGKITRVFGNELNESIMRELRFAWDDSELYDYYVKKSGGLIANFA